MGLLAKMAIRLEKSETGCKLMEGTASLCEERNSVQSRAMLILPMEKSDTWYKIMRAMEGTASLWEERNSVTAAGDDDGVRSSHQHT